MHYQEDNAEAFEWLLDKLSAKKAPALRAPIAQPPRIKKDLGETKAKDIHLYNAYKDSGWHPDHLDPLYDHFKPMIEDHARRYKSSKVEIPHAALDFEYKQRFVDAVKKYDPDKGTALGSWVRTNLQKTSRYVNNLQNFARIPETISGKIGTYKAVKAELREQLGHEPNDIQILEAAQKVDARVTMGDIKRLNKELRKGLIATGGIEDLNPMASFSSRNEEVVQLIYHQLTDQEKLVHEYTFGLNGKPALKPGAISKKTGLDQSKVAKLRTSIYGKMKPYLE